MDVGVDKVRQVSAEAAEIADGNGGFPAKFTFDGQIRLVNGRRLELGIKECYAERASAADRCGLCGKNLRELGCAGGSSAGGIKPERELTAVDTGVDESIVNGGIDDAAVVDAVATADGGLSIAKHVVSEADARAPIVGVARQLLGVQYAWIREERLGQLFVLEADTEVEG